MRLVQEPRGRQVAIAARSRPARISGWTLAAILGLAAAAALILYVLIWYGPDMIARHDIGSVTGPLRVFRMQQALDAARDGCSPSARAYSPPRRWYSPPATPSCCIAQSSSPSRAK